MVLSKHKNFKIKQMQKDCGNTQNEQFKKKILKPYKP